MSPLSKHPEQEYSDVGGMLVYCRGWTRRSVDRTGYFHAAHRLFHRKSALLAEFFDGGQWHWVVAKEGGKRLEQPPTPYRTDPPFEWADQMVAKGLV